MSKCTFVFTITDVEFDMFHTVAEVECSSIEVGDSMWAELAKVPDSCVAVEYLDADGEERGDGYVTEETLEHLFGIPFSKLLHDFRKTETRRIQRAMKKRMTQASTPLTITALQKEAFATAAKNGFHEEDEQPPSFVVQHIAARGLHMAKLCEAVELTNRGMLAEGPATEVAHLDARQIRVIAWLTLLNTEVAEAIEDVLAGRWDLTIDENGKPHGVPSELADVVIMAGNHSEALGIDLTAAIRAKLVYNKTRSRYHGGKKL